MQDWFVSYAYEGICDELRWLYGAGQDDDWVLSGCDVEEDGTLVLEGTLTSGHEITLRFSPAVVDDLRGECPWRPRDAHLSDFALNLSIVIGEVICTHPDGGTWTLTDDGPPVRD